MALIVFGITYYISIKVSHTLQKRLKNQIAQDSIRSLIASVSSFLIITLGIFISLNILDLDNAFKSILTGAGVAGLAVGLALQGTLSNTFSGIFLAVKDIMNVGDYVETNGYSGVVEAIDLRFVRLREVDNNIVIIPNKLILDNPFKNYGLTTQIRVSLECGVSYNSDLTRVKQVVEKTIKEEFPEYRESKVEFFFTNFGNSDIQFLVRFWVEAQRKLSVLEAKSIAMMRIKKCLDDNNINIPYPTMEIYSQQKHIS